MNLVIIRNTDINLIEQVEEYIRKHDNSHFLQSPRWRSVKNNWNWAAVTVWEQGELCGVLSILIRSLPLGFTVLYAPRGPVCDRTEAGVLEMLMDGARQLARENNGVYLMMDPDAQSGTELTRFLDDHGFVCKEDDGFDGVQPQHVFRLQLHSVGEESLLMGFSSKTRYNIRLAQKKGVVIRNFSGDEDIPEGEFIAFSDLMEETGRRDGFIVRGKAYFQRLLRSFGNDAVLWIAYYEGAAIAGSLQIIYGNKSWYLYGASADRFRNVMPNYLLQWRMILRAREAGCSLYDFRGVPAKDSDAAGLMGLYRFKQGFRGEYTSFCGLYVLYTRPIVGRLVHWGIGIVRKLRRDIKRTGKR